MKLHVPSVLSSFGVLALVVLLSSQGTLLPAGLRFEYMPHPRDMVTIKEGTQFTVPSGKLFVLTALGSTHELDVATLRIDGVDTLRTQCTFTPGDGSCMKTVPSGLAIGAGSTVSVEVGKGWGRAWGYLANQ